MASQRVELIHTPNYEQIKTAFLQELIRASQNKSSSISFVKQQRSHKPLIKEGVVQGIVIGGTNYVLSTEEVKENGKRNVLERKAGMLPVFDTKKTFEDFLSEHLDSRAYAIGINFGFKLDPVTGLHGALDGKIIAKGTKDHAFIGTTEPIGAIARNIFKNRYNKEIPIAVTNDAVALLFAGDGTEEASLIAGTGFNMGMRIDNTLINLEAGGFDKFPLSKIFQKLDKDTKNPGKKLFEKNISGMYLAKIFNLWAEELNIITSPVFTGQELSAIAHAYHNESAKRLARVVLDQSASYIGAAIVALYEFKDKPRNFTIIAEGGLMWDGWHYHESLMNQIEALGISSKEITIKNIKDSSIHGAIGLVLS